jgi:hypothetical protein
LLLLFSSYVCSSNPDRDKVDKVNSRRHNSLLHHRAQQHRLAKQVQVVVERRHNLRLRLKKRPL